MKTEPLRVIHSAAEFSTTGRKAALAIGMFDGVHLGHQQVIRQAVADAEQHEGVAIVVTFDQHPNTVVAPTRVPPLIYSLAQKMRAIASLDADAALLVHFDEAFSQQPGENFIRQLARDFAPLHSITVGSSFTFGHKRDGNVELLRKLGAELNFSVHGIAAVSLDSEPVSSTRIRETIRSGALDRAAEMLGRKYALAGTIVRGDHIGRKFGFPTANLDATGRALPQNGVYAVHAYVRGIRHRAVLNIGVRPTLASPTPQPRVEAHLLNFNGDIYGEEMELTFVQKLRDERRFPSLDELRAQIQRDVRHALEVFNC
ncbi:MAG TPA: bifunctional riboflavin kinase/FAD synthetase [Candidatus Acidoferrum sp.]|nr:bifunctional riboflavin kinase/FAD synthetase [Candidatus Acidoferrum sp.]